MKSRIAITSIVLMVATLFATSTLAGPGRGHGGGGAMIVRLADIDGDGTTTAAEFEDFLVFVDTSGDGIIDETEIEAPFVFASFDRDGDGLLELEDLRQTFAELDQNGDGAITSTELPRFPRGARGGFAAGFLARLADADENGTVTGAEWQALIIVFDIDQNGVVEESEWLTVAPGREGSESRPERYEAFTRILDRNDNGILETSDVAATFAELDVDQNGVVDGDELPGRRGR